MKDSVFIKEEGKKPKKASCWVAASGRCLPLKGNGVKWDASLVTTSCNEEPSPNFHFTHHCNSLSYLTIAFSLLTLSLSNNLGSFNTIFLSFFLLYVVVNNSLCFNLQYFFEALLMTKDTFVQSND